MKKFLNGNRILSKYFFILCLLLPQLALAHNFTTEQKEGIRLFKEGVKLADEKKYMDSLVFFDNAMTKFPKLTSAYYAKSKVLATLGKNEEALKCFENVQKANYRSSVLQNYFDYFKGSLGVSNCFSKNLHF